MAKKTTPLSPLSTTVSRHITSLRLRSGLSQQDFATALGISMVSVNRWERGHAAPSGIGLVLLDLLEEAIFGKDLSGPKGVGRILRDLRMAASLTNKVRVLMMHQEAVRQRHAIEKVERRFKKKIEEKNGLLSSAVQLVRPIGNFAEQRDWLARAEKSLEKS